MPEFKLTKGYEIKEIFPRLGDRLVFKEFREKVKDYYEFDPSFFYTLGLFYKEQLIGLVQLQQKGKSDPHAQVGIVILAKFQKKGMGQLLLRKIEEAALEQGFDSLESMVAEKNLQSLWCFFKRGYRIERTYRYPNGKVLQFLRKVIKRSEKDGTDS